MNIELTEISESDFKKLDLPTLFEDKLTDRTFGVVSDGKNKYKLGWQSENIKPVVKWINVIFPQLAAPKTKEFQSDSLLLSCWNVGNSESFPYFNRNSVGAK